MLVRWCVVVSLLLLAGCSRDLAISSVLSPCRSDMECSVWARCTGGRCIEKVALDAGQPQPAEASVEAVAESARGAGPEPGLDAGARPEPGLDTGAGPEPEVHVELPAEVAWRDGQKIPDDPTLPVVAKQLYVHTSKILYRLHNVTRKLEFVWDFSFDQKSTTITDIALARDGKLYAVSSRGFYVCDRLTAFCRWQMEVSNNLTALAFVVEDGSSSKEELLVGCDRSGRWFRFVLSEQAAKPLLVRAGLLGQGYGCSGDIVSLRNQGTFVLITKAGINDHFARVDPRTGKILQILGDTKVRELWGLAWWQGRFYAFQSKGTIYELDARTGLATPTRSITFDGFKSWWGATSSPEASGG